jgi:hypothetical protein
VEDGLSSKQLRCFDSNVDMLDSKAIICVADPNAGDSKPRNIDSIPDERYIFKRCEAGDPAPM